MKLDSVRGLSSARARPRPRLQHDMPYRWSVVEMRQVRLVWQVRQGRIVPVEWHKFLLPFNVVGRVDMEKINVMWQTSSFYPIKITQPDHDDTWWEYVRDVTRHETIMHNNYIMELLPSGREWERYREWYVYKPINHCRNFHLLDRLSIRRNQWAPNCHGEYISGGGEVRQGGFGPVGRLANASASVRCCLRASFNPLTHTQNSRTTPATSPAPLHTWKRANQWARHARLNTESKGRTLKLF